MTELNALVSRYYDGLREVYAGRPLPDSFGIVLTELNQAMESGQIALNPATHTCVIPGSTPPADIVQSALEVAIAQKDDPARSAAGAERDIAELELLLSQLGTPSSGVTAAPERTIRVRQADGAIETFTAVGASLDGAPSEPQASILDTNGKPMQLESPFGPGGGHLANGQPLTALLGIPNTAEQQAAIDALVADALSTLFGDTA